MTIAGAVFVLPVALLIVVFYLQISADATFFRSERSGVAYTKALRPLFADLEAARLAAGDSAARARIGPQADADFSLALAADAGAGKVLLLTAALKALETKWHAGGAPAPLLDDLIALLVLRKLKRSLIRSKTSPTKRISSL